jgi:hypothetical protein
MIEAIEAIDHLLLPHTARQKTACREEWTTLR